MWKDIRRHAARTGQAAAFALGLLASPALAYQITVGGTTYDISFVTTSYDASTGLLTSQPWWQDTTLAEDIVDALVLDGFNEFTEFGITGVYFLHSAPPAVVLAQQVSLGSDNGLVLLLAPDTANYATGTIVGPAAVPEIDGNALAKALFILFALGAWLDTRRRRAQGVSPRIALAD
ncbi:MAG: hypothetical protein ACE368_22610 [Paracoccaceae bacterium]